MERTGFVLEGGGMRGIYTAGRAGRDDGLGRQARRDSGRVGRAPSMERALSPPKGRNIRYTKKYCRNWRFMSLRSLLVTGDLVGRAFSYEELPYRLDPFDFDACLKSPVRFYALATDVETGGAVCLDGKRDAHTLLEVLRASSSMPLVSTIVAWEGRRHLTAARRTRFRLPIRGHGPHCAASWCARSRRVLSATDRALALMRALPPLSRLCPGR